MAPRPGGRLAGPTRRGPPPLEAAHGAGHGASRTTGAVLWRRPDRLPLRRHRQLLVGERRRPKASEPRRRPHSRPAHIRAVQRSARPALHLSGGQRRPRPRFPADCIPCRRRSRAHSASGCHQEVGATWPRGVHGRGSSCRARGGPRHSSHTDFESGHRGGLREVRIGAQEPGALRPHVHRSVGGELSNGD